MLALLAALTACAPSADSCRDLMPVEGLAALPARTPAATRGCTAEQDGVTIQVEAIRRNMTWERGRIWIDGVETPESDLSSTLLAAHARLSARGLGAQAGRVVRSLKDSAHALVDGFRNPPAVPPAPPTPPAAPAPPPP
jgi:hypothetical protein